MPTSSGRKPSRSLVMTAAALLAIALCALSALPPCHALNVKLSGVNYDFRQGPDWERTHCKTKQTIQKDLQLLATITPRIRVYSISDCKIDNVLTLAKQYNLTVWLGIWVDDKALTFQNELKALDKLITSGLIDDNIVGINVGSEAMYRNEADADQVYFFSLFLARTICNTYYHKRLDPLRLVL